MNAKLQKPVCTMVDLIFGAGFVGSIFILIVGVSKPFFWIAYSYWTFLENASSRA